MLLNFDFNAQVKMDRFLVKRPLGILRSFDVSRNCRKNVLIMII